jgi:hypothetical protein
VKILNPSQDKNNEIRATEAIIYSDKPVNGLEQNMEAAKREY